MKYIVYKTTNTINGKIYVGVHAVPGDMDNDSYMGCGLSLKRKSTAKEMHIPFHRAVQKYGYDAFKREVLLSIQLYKKL